MNYNGQYLTYREHIDLGGTLEQTPFNLLEYEARKKIDERTQGRLKKIDTTEMPQEVKMCMYALINCLSGYNKNSLGTINKNIVSESIDGYSVSYVNSTQFESVVNSKNIELNDIIKTYLTGVIVNNQHILYLGVK